MIRLSYRLSSDRFGAPTGALRSWPILPSSPHRAEGTMAKRKMTPTTAETFGERLARLRLAAGYSQRDLAAEVGISQRMVAYYEGETSYPPSHLLPVLAKVLR